MATFLLASLANTLILLPAPYGLAGIALLVLLAGMNAAQLARAAQTPLQASLDQIGRLLAWLIAPAIVMDQPFIRLTNIGLLHDLLLNGPSPTPALLCGGVLGFLTITSLALAGTDSLRHRLAARRAASVHHDTALAPMRPATTAAQERLIADLLAQVEDLNHRMTRAEDTLRSVIEEADTTDADGQSALQFKSKCAAHVITGATPPAPETESAADIADTAAIDALREQGYYDGPWSEDRSADADDTYPPISDDADFLKIMETR